MLKIIMCLLVFWSQCALNTPLRADDPHKILATLRHVDKVLRQGSISYNEIQASGAGATRMQVSLDYSSNGCFNYVAIGTVNSKPETYEIIFDGKDELWIFPDQKEIQFKIPKSSGDFGATDGLNYALGRGLSGLENITVTQDSMGIHLIGIDDNGMRMDALLDPKHAYIAKEILRKDQEGDITGKWSFSSTHDIGNGMYVAMKSVSDIGHETHIHSELSVKKMNARAPEQSRFAYHWMRPGFHIVDLRLGSTDMGRFQSSDIPPTTTSAQLLEMSRQQITSRAELHAANVAAKKTYGQQSATKSIALMVILVCLTGIIIAAIITRRKHSI